jgi:RNA polymerase sigma-70 factor (ECF subfamily)
MGLYQRHPIGTKRARANRIFERDVLTGGGKDRIGRADCVQREEDYPLVRQLCAPNRESREAAFEALYRKHRDRVFNTAFRVMGDRGLAADITQETFLTILRKARKFDFRSAFTSWIYRVTVNLCIDLRRKLSKRRSVSMSEPDVVTWVEATSGGQSGEPGPEAAARSAELGHLVGKAISALNPRLGSVGV